MVASLLFLIVRGLIIFSAVDHISHASAEELHVAYHARAIYEGREIANPYKHLWGLKPTAYALVPFLALGATDMMALKFLAVLVSFLGFFCLVFLFAWRLGPLPATVLALMLIFPDTKYLKWSLMIWGGYPEAASLICLPILLFAAALVSKSRTWLLAAGLFTALVVSYSVSIIFIPLVMAILFFFPRPIEQPFKMLGVYSLGFLLGLIPLAVWMAQDPENLMLEERALGVARDLTPLLDCLSIPSWQRLVELFDKARIWQFFYNPLVTILLALSTCWLLIRGVYFAKTTERNRWNLLFPLCFLVGPLAISAFPFTKHLLLRHVIWFYPAAYVCLAIWLSGRSIRGNSKWAVKVYRFVEIPLKTVLFLAVLAPNLWAISPIIQPADMSMLLRYRGLSYYDRGIYNVLGDEVHQINCVLDELPEPMSDRKFISGFAYGFRMVELWEDFLWQPFRPRYHLELMAPPNNEEDFELFYRGYGCAVAIKPNLDYAELDVIENKFGPGRRKFAETGYSLCATLPCLKEKTAK